MLLVELLDDSIYIFENRDGEIRHSYRPARALVIDNPS